MAFSIQVNEEEQIFTAVFQPIVSIKDNCIVSMEVLSRPQSSDDIESLLKQISLDGNLRTFTLALIDEIKNLCDLIPKMVRYLSLNVTVGHMCSTCLLDDLNELIRKLSKRNIQLVIELPEGESYPGPDTRIRRKLIDNIESLKSQNVLIAIDDFGKGTYVSETEVLYLMPDILKVDRDVVQKPNKNQDIWQMVDSIREKLDLIVVAEGIESSKDLSLVVEKGVRFCQGFYFGRPKALC